MVIKGSISKSEFKARALEYLRRVETTGEGLVVTDRGRAVVRILPIAPEPTEALAKLSGSVLHYDDPLEPVASADWEALR